MKNRLISIVLGSALMVASSLAIANELPEGAVNMSKVLESLKSKGYNFIKEIKFDDGVYEVKAFNLDGNEVKIKIDPKTGNIIPEQKVTDRMTALDVSKRLEAMGYSKISEIEMSRDLNKYEIKALNKEGKKVKVDVDAKTGNISKDWF